MLFFEKHPMSESTVSAIKNGNTKRTKIIENPPTVSPPYR
jgi:hypothetical protein